MDDRLKRECILTNGMRVNRKVKNFTMVLLRTMALDHPMFLEELIRYCRDEDGETQLSAPAIKFLIPRDAIAPHKTWIRENVRQIVQLAAQGDPRHPVIIDPEVYPPWSSGKT
ncbi:MAG: hypothetical protein WCW34_01400 [Patescibacteria group bacterium]|jgi:hypothetical protein